MHVKRRLRRLVRFAVETITETQWLLPVLGALAGVALGLVFARIGQDPNPGSWTISVDRARDTLMGMLALIFTGLSIVLALASVTTQSVVSRFSLRMVRIYTRRPLNKRVIAVFALTAGFVLAVQLQFRGLPPDSLAPVGGVLGSGVMLVIAGVAIILYISAVVGWFRVDRVARHTAEIVFDTALATSLQGDDPPASGWSLEQPVDAVPVAAPREGFLADLDLDGLFRLASNQDASIVIDRDGGVPVAHGEPIGWVTGADASAVAGGAAAHVDLSRYRELSATVGYGVVVLVDIAIMALSPAVNDPYTAVEVVERMTLLFPRLADLELGPYGRVDAEGRQRVVVRSPMFGELVELATDQIVLYGSEDPAVVAALRRFVDVLNGLDLHGADRAAVAALEQRVAALAGQEPDD